ncbi:hypothetical protein G4B88_004879 [Cannabis sativa]|uniref:Importin N-terminal domain-containing protein n=1 Tax=Cannabis sativa TaxID=3483 RepID=A0A7J6FVG9_CANSA|nr:hypothetical protein G4B88_004879 [Cannabis sativa]
MAAAVNFKNHLKGRWAPSASSDEPNAVASPSPIPDPKKDQIKALIVSLMLSANPKIPTQPPPLGDVEGSKLPFSVRLLKVTL